MPNSGSRRCEQADPSVPEPTLSSIGAATPVGANSASFPRRLRPASLSGLNCGFRFTEGIAQLEIVGTLAFRTRNVASRPQRSDTRIESD